MGNSKKFKYIVLKTTLSKKEIPLEVGIPRNGPFQLTRIVSIK